VKFFLSNLILIRISVLFFGFCNIIITSNLLSVEDFGKFTFTVSILQFFIYLLNFGFPNVLAILIPKSEFKNTKPILFRQKFFLSALFSLIFFSNLVLKFFNPVLLLIVFINVFLWINAFALNINNYKNSTFIFGQFRPGGGVLINFLFFIFIFFSFLSNVPLSIDDIFLYLFFSCLISLCLSEIYISKIFKNNDSKVSIREILEISIPIGLQKSIDPIQEAVFFIMCNYFLSDSELGVFLFGYRIGTLVWNLFATVLDVNFSPLISNDIVNNNSKNLNQLLQQKTIIHFLSTIFLGLIIFLMYDFIVQIFFPNYLYAKQLILIFIIALSIICFFVDTISPGEIMRLSNKIIIFRFISLSFYLIPFFFSNQNMYLYPFLFTLQFSCVRLLTTKEINQKIKIDYFVRFYKNNNIKF
jgi:O-antigen/teichoic acid export membrane protein